MLGIVVFALYLTAGYICAHVVLWDKSPLLRIWLGLSFGVLLFMWLPALAAFFVRFTLAGQLISLGVVFALAGAAVYVRWRHPRTAAKMSREDWRMAIALGCFALPMTILSAYLQHTHTLREVDGTLHVGQATYGDMCMHLSIVTGMRGASLPTEYIILPGAPMGYPLLTDTTGTSMMLWGTALRWSMIIPGTVMSALVYMGYLLLAREMGGSLSAAVIAAALLFFNGGLGFVYDLDLTGGTFDKINEALRGWYLTPANQPDLNLRWSNLVADLLLPQRTFLGGWTLLLPALYFAREAFAKQHLRMFLLVALFGAALPLVHTHSFLALALYSAGALAYAFFAYPARRRKLLIRSAIYLGIVVAAAAPQLFGFTLRQASNEGFIALHTGWVNHTDNGYIDFPIWFWLKNVGLPLIVMVFALLDWRKHDRMDGIGAALIFLVANTVIFQPLHYDNNKLFYVWFLLMLPMVGHWCVSLWGRLRGRRSRVLLAALFLAGSTLSGAMSIAREVDSDYQLFDVAEVKAGAFIDANTEPDAMFLTGQQHINPVYALAGRRVVCGPSLYLTFHGYWPEFAVRETQVRAFYKNPADNLALLEAYDVRYIAVGAWERGDLEVNEEALDALFDVIYDEDGYKLYAVASGETAPEAP